MRRICRSTSSRHARSTKPPRARSERCVEAALERAGLGKKRVVGQAVDGTVPCLFAWSSLFSTCWVLRKAFQASIGGSAPLLSPPYQHPTHLSRLLSFLALRAEQSKTSYTFIICSPPLAKGTPPSLPSPVKRLVDCASDTTSLPASSHTVIHTPFHIPHPLRLHRVKRTRA